MQIILLVFALLTIVSSWSAWRRSPLYSAKATVKIAGAFLLIAATIWAVAMAILSGPFSGSPVAQAILGIVAVVVLTTGASVLVIRITDAHVAQLPSSVRLVAIHRHKVQRWIWRTTVYLLINAGAALFLPASWIWLPLVLGSFVLLLCGPMLGILYMMARRNDRGMSALIAAPWVRWEYTAAEWNAWIENQLAWERSKAKPMTLRQAIVMVLLCAGLFGLGALLTGGSFRENMIIVGGLLAFIIVLLIAATWFGRGASKRHDRRLRAAPPEAYFGDEGLYCNGEYAPWILSGSYLIEATAPRDPPARLMLLFQSFNGSTSVQAARRTPLPAGCDADLALLQQKLRTRCPKAAIHLVTPS